MNPALRIFLYLARAFGKHSVWLALFTFEVLSCNIFTSFLVKISMLSGIQKNTYIRDHGIDEDLIRKAMEASKKYFTMPTDVKEAFPRDPTIQQGYVR